MKRFAFWFVAALIAFSWVSHRHEGRLHRPPQSARTKMIVRSVASSDKSGRGQRVYIVESDDHRLVTIDDQGVHLSNENAKSLDYDEDDSDDNDILASADGLPVRIVPGSRVTEARIEAPRPPEPPKPPKAPKPPKHVRVKHHCKHSVIRVFVALCQRVNTLPGTTFCDMFIIDRIAHIQVCYAFV